MASTRTDAVSFGSPEKQRAMKLAPDEPVMLEHYGDTLVKVGNSEKAKESYERALQFSKDDVERGRIGKKIRDLSKP